MRFLTGLALALLLYDGVLHAITLAVGRASNGRPLVDLPWLLFPVFPTWAMYDAVWGGVHFAAFAVLALRISR